VAGKRLVWLRCDERLLPVVSQRRSSGGSFLAVVLVDGAMADVARYGKHDRG
jgi:hypothetical protein